MPRSHIL